MARIKVVDKVRLSFSNLSASSMQTSSAMPTCFLPLVSRPEYIFADHVYPSVEHSLNSFIPYLCDFAGMYCRNISRPLQGTIV